MFFPVIQVDGMAMKEQVSKNSSNRLLEVLHGLERIILGADSPGLKLAAGLAVEVLSKNGIMARPLFSSSKATVTFSVSVTVLSSDMGKVLVKNSATGKVLPRRYVCDDDQERLSVLALQLAREFMPDNQLEIVLDGRPLGVEFWDDHETEITIGLNFLMISRSSCAPMGSDYLFRDFRQLNIEDLDPREILILSEMLTIMGIKNPYDILKEASSEEPAA